MIEDKIKKSVETLRLAAEMSRTYYEKPMILCFSGGKDSSVLLDLAEKHLTPDDFTVLNSHTTVDTPETVYFIRSEFDRLRGGGITAEVDYKKDKNGNPITMWNLIPKKGMPPTRIQRYCCQVLKETSTPNSMAILGVRAAESTKRRGRETFGILGNRAKDAKYYSLDHADEVYHESLDRDPVWDCTLIHTMRNKGDTVVNPIYEWTDADIWQYIRDNKLKINPMYECGYSRVGCVLCPLSAYKNKLKDIAEYPKYAAAYKRAFDRMIEKAREKAIQKGEEYRGDWNTGDEVFEWWIEMYKHEVKGQIKLDLEKMQ